MLTIRKEQAAVFQKRQIENFEDRVLKHLRRVWYDQVITIGEPATRDSIRKGIARAKSYGIIIEYDVVRYIDLMWTLDQDFDTHPKLPWAAYTLKSPGTSPREKMDLLCARTRAELHSRANCPRR